MVTKNMFEAFPPLLATSY